jgi:uncharacterized protein
MGSSDTQAVFFASAGEPPVELDGLLDVPADASPARPCPSAVLCHPQPASSDMRDPLLAEVAAQLVGRGVAALRFNFRGVGRSQGAQTDGRLEPLDVAGAIDYLLSQPFVRPDKLCVIGHAFGAYVALAYAAYDPRVRTVVAVSPPLARLEPGLGTFDRPKLFVTGEYDEVSPRHKLESWVEQLPGRALLVISGAHHLMAGYEDVAAGTIVRYVERWAEAPGL